MPEAGRAEHGAVSLRLLVSFVFIACGGLLFGYIIGINGSILVQQRCAAHDGRRIGSWSSLDYYQCFYLTPEQEGFLSSMNLIGACTASVICFFYADNLGRKREMQLAGLLYLMGTVIAVATPMLWGIFIGFLVYGLGIGFAMHSAPVYIAEICPAHLRGSFVSAKEAIIVVGIFLGFVGGCLCELLGPYGWRMMVTLAGVVALIMVMGITGMPESPRFLVLKASLAAQSTDTVAYLESAKRALEYFNGGIPAEVELDALAKDVKGSVEELQPLTGRGQQNRVNTLLEPFSHWRPMTIGCGLVLLQQVTGQPSVLYFATNIFMAAGFRTSASMQTVWVGLVKLFATLVTVSWVDKYGRRFLLFSGISMMVAALVLLTVSFLFSACKTPGVSVQHCKSEHVSLPTNMRSLTVAALMLYVSGYQVGFGPISWLVISEIFPLKVRGSALSVAALINFSSNAITTTVTPVLLLWITPAGLFGVFLLMSLFSIFFVYHLVPETKGKSLEEIEADMTG